MDTSLRSKEATTEAKAEKSNLRARDWARLCNTKCNINKTNTTKFLKKRQKKRETGCGCPVDTSLRSKEATTEAEAEKSNLRARDWARFCNKKGHLLRHPFYCKKRSARRGSNPRPPPWQGGAPPLSHSRIVSCVSHARHIILYGNGFVNNKIKKS